MRCSAMEMQRGGSERERWVRCQASKEVLREVVLLLVQHEQVKKQRESNGPTWNVEHHR